MTQVGKLKKLLLRYYPPGVILQYERDESILHRPVNLLALSQDENAEVSCTVCTLPCLPMDANRFRPRCNPKLQSLKIHSQVVHGLLYSHGEGRLDAWPVNCLVCAQVRSGAAASTACTSEFHAITESPVVASFF